MFVEHNRAGVALEHSIIGKEKSLNPGNAPYCGQQGLVKGH